MPSSLGLSEAWVLALFLAGLLHGVFLATFGLALKALLLVEVGPGRVLRPKSRVHWNMVVTGIALFAIAALDLGMVMTLNMTAFKTGLDGQPQEPGSSDAVFRDISFWPSVIHSFCVVSQTAIGDAVLIYRLWVVWDRRLKVVVFPIALLAAHVGCSMTMVATQARMHKDELITKGPFVPLITSFWCLTLVLNVFTTSLIVFRIWQVDQSNKQFRRTQITVTINEGSISASSGSSGTRRSNSEKTILQRIIKILVESGLLYTTMAIITFVTYMVNDNSNFTNSAAVIQVVGIAFNLIVIRTQNLRSGNTYYHTS